MKLWRCVRKGFWCAAAALLAAGALAMGADAGDRSCSVTLNYPLEGSQFSIYRVGDVSDEDGSFILQGDFSGYSVDLKDDAAAKTLEAYVLRDAPAPLAQAKTDEEGKVRFTGLSMGVYLILGESADKDGYRYTPAPVLTQLPGWGEKDLRLWDVEIQEKYDRTDVPRDALTVIKVWKGDKESNRPEEIQVQLLRDGKVWETVTLNADNHWKYTWKKLSGRHDWTVAEKSVPKGYQVAVKENDGSFTITNTRSSSGHKGHDGGNGGSDAPGGKRLPQTGLLWWPVLLLDAAGLTLIAAGVYRRRRAERS